MYLLMFSGIDLENIVYYKDNTHYFVMTAKKQSLLEKGVIINVSMHTRGEQVLWHCSLCDGPTNIDRVAASPWRQFTSFPCSNNRAIF